VATFSVQILPAAQAELDELPSKPRRQVERHILQLADNPTPAGAVALKGKQYQGLLRIRSGDYRIIYRVQHQQLIVVVVKIGNRKDVYH
jgi:mRNA interferase RelE/StbE